MLRPLKHGHLAAERKTLQAEESWFVARAGCGSWL